MNKIFLIVAALSLAGCNTVSTAFPDAKGDRAIAAPSQPSQPPVCEGGDGQPPR